MKRPSSTTLTEMVTVKNMLSQIVAVALVLPSVGAEIAIPDAASPVEKTTARESALAEFGVDAYRETTKRQTLTDYLNGQIEKAAEPYVIATRPDATPSEAFAAEELQTHLRLALGQDIPIVTNAVAAAAVFELGTDRAKDVIGDARVTALRDEESIYVVRDSVVAIAGGGAAGLCYGVYTYLEQELGARWFDQESDPVIRKVKKLDFRPREYREKPRLDYRMILCTGENRHPKFNGDKPRRVSGRI